MKNPLHKQCPIASCRLILFFAVIFLCSAQYNFAQLCTGSLSYVIRDESGAKMSESQLEKVIIREIDGKEPVMEKKAILGKDSPEQVYYKVGSTGDLIRIRFANPLYVPDLCGNINSLTLQYEKKTMMLLFENTDNWRRYVIDSLPFQEGIFRLKKKNEGGGRNYESTPCDEFVPGRQTGPLSYTKAMCNVFAQSWVRIDEKKNQD